MSDEAESVTVAAGGCLCGAVRYRVTGPMRPVIACHCRQCQRTHGNFAAYSAVASEDLTFVEERGLKWFRSSPNARRGFCGECGASLFWDPATAGYVAVAAGSIDPPSRLKTVRHIFVADKGDYYEITDDLEQLPQGQN